MTSKHRILVVDDDEAVLDFLNAKLGARYDIIATNAPERVLALAREHRPNVIVCDVDMPELDGGDVSRQLFDDPGVRDIPVLFLTALASPEDLKHLSGQLGGRPAVSKRAPIAELVARIERLTQP